MASAVEDLPIHPRINFNHCGLSNIWYNRHQHPPSTLTTCKVSLHLPKCPKAGIAAPLVIRAFFCHTARLPQLRGQLVRHPQALIGESTSFIRHTNPPRMTKCGHTACLPCFIRYFASEDVVTGLRGSSIKFCECPICWDSIEIGEVKPVRWYIIDDGMDDENIVVAREPQEGFDVVMRLFMRKWGTTVALPRDDFVQVEQTEMLHEGDVPWHYVPEILHYTWIVKGGEMYMKDESEREIVDLQTMEKEDELFGDDPVWTHSAIQRIHNASETYTGLGSGPSSFLLLSTATRFCCGAEDH
jgi:hypothetical protein